MGYLGYMELEKLAGIPRVSPKAPSTRSTPELINLRVTKFNKDTPFTL
jgi:hypothetical protein